MTQKLMPKIFIANLTFRSLHLYQQAYIFSWPIYIASMQVSKAPIPSLPPPHLVQKLLRLFVQPITFRINNIQDLYEFCQSRIWHKYDNAEVFRVNLGLSKFDHQDGGYSLSNKGISHHHLILLHLPYQLHLIHTNQQPVVCSLLI